MNLVFGRFEDCGILEFIGEVRDIGPREVRALAEEIRRNKGNSIIFDLRRVTQISTGGWGMIFSVRRRLADIGAVLVLVGDAEALSRTSPHGPLNQFIPICPTLGLARIAAQRELFNLRKAEREASERRDGGGEGQR